MNDPDVRDAPDIGDALDWVQEVLDLKRRFGVPLTEAETERTLQIWRDLYREAGDAPDTHHWGSQSVPPFSCPEDAPGERNTNK